ncbi:MAG TPA: MFS transporter [Gemmatimonadales bacterium]|nr:MFS transporter [Gemmatimonadales bacterium]
MNRAHDTPEVRTLARVKRRLLPFLFLMYLTELLTRGNVGLAALQMRADLGFSATVFGFGAGVFLFGYSPFAVPSNLIVARVGARRWIPVVLIGSGVLGSAMMLVRSPLSFYAMRFLLGVAEAGFFPAVIYYLGAWMPAEQRARVTAQFMTAIPVSGVVSGALAAPLLALDGRLGLAGWQWLFLIDGLPAVVLGVLAYSVLTDEPAQAQWLPPEERAWLVERLQRERAAPAEGHSGGLRDALADPALYWLGLLNFLVMASAYAKGVWSPQMIKAASHLGDSQVSLLTSVIAGASVIAMLANGAHSDLRHERRLHIAVPAMLMALGWFLCAGTDSGALTVFALTMVAVGMNSQYGPFWTLPAARLSGRTRAAGIAVTGALGTAGGFVGLFLVGWIRDVTGAYRLAFLILGLMACVAALLALRRKITVPSGTPRLDRSTAARDAG